MFKREKSSNRSSDEQHANGNGDAIVVPPHRQSGKKSRLPFHKYHTDPTLAGKQREAGEAYRSGIHPWHMLRITFRSSSKLSCAVNVLWPVVPAAIAVHFARPDWPLIIFILNYIAMVPAANTIGFAGQELARKLPKVFGVLLETTFGSVVEIILFTVLISKSSATNPTIPVIRAAILGSILANLLLCLGACFIAGGFNKREQEFHEVVSETGNGLLLVAGMGLVIPAVFSNAINGLNIVSIEEQANLVIKLSRGTGVLLFCSFLAWVVFQMVSHHGLYDDVFEKDEAKDRDGHKDLTKDKLTASEAIFILCIALACVAMSAVFLVQEIEYLVAERGVSDAFLGLILVPLVEKFAEHLTALDEAYDNQANFALAHVLGASLQTALLNTPIVIFIGWGIGGAHQMDLNFGIYESVTLILAILVLGNFLRDGKSNWLEGILCIFVYVIIAVGAFYFPNSPHEGAENAGPTAE